jgi:hypothetical protein
MKVALGRYLAEDRRQKTEWPQKSTKRTKEDSRPFDRMTGSSRIRGTALV